MEVKDTEFEVAFSAMDVPDKQILHMLEDITLLSCKVIVAFKKWY